MKIRKLNKRYILNRALGYTFSMYRRLDDNNNEYYTLTVSNRALKIKEHVLLTKPTYIVGMFYGDVQEYLFDVIERAINLKINSLGLSDILYLERHTDGFKVHKADSVYYEEVFYVGCEELYNNLEDVVVNYKNYF